MSEFAKQGTLPQKHISTFRLLMFVRFDVALGPVYMRKNMSPARPGADRRGKKIS